MAPTTTSVGMKVLSMPVAKPEMMTVAGPVCADSAMRRVGK